MSFAIFACPNCMHRLNEHYWFDYRPPERVGACGRSDCTCQGWREVDDG